MSKTRYRITVRRTEELRGHAITSLNPLRRAKGGLVAGLAIRFGSDECEAVLVELRERYPALIFARVAVQ